MGTNILDEPVASILRTEEQSLNAHEWEPQITHGYHQ
jgi:hypothetical protein